MTLFEIATNGSVIAMLVAFLAGAYYGIKMILWLDKRYKNSSEDGDRKRNSKRRDRK